MPDTKAAAEVDIAVLAEQALRDLELSGDPTPVGNVPTDFSMLRHSSSMFDSAAVEAQRAHLRHVDAHLGDLAIAPQSDARQPRTAGPVLRSEDRAASVSARELPASQPAALEPTRTAATPADPQHEGGPRSALQAPEESSGSQPPPVPDSGPLKGLVLERPRAGSSASKVQPQEVATPFNLGSVDGYMPSCTGGSDRSTESPSAKNVQMVADLEFSVLGKQQYTEMGQDGPQEPDGPDPDVLSADDRAILREIRCFDAGFVEDRDNVDDDDHHHDDDDDHDANRGVALSSFMKIYSIVLDWATPRASHYLQELHAIPLRCTVCTSTWNLSGSQGVPVTTGGIKRRKSIHHMLHVEACPPANRLPWS